MKNHVAPAAFVSEPRWRMEMNSVLAPMMRNPSSEKVSGFHE